MIFDTHAHYDDDWFDEDRDSLLRGMAAAGVGRIVNIGSTWKSLEITKSLTETYDFVYGAYGIHPDEIGDLSEERFEELRGFLASDKAVAVGEIGLDYYHNTENKPEQQEWFERGTGAAHRDPQPGGRGGYDDHGKDTPLRRHRRRGTLLFLFPGDRPGVHQNGFLHRRRRCGDL